jgi:hypothetical protein
LLLHSRVLSRAFRTYHGVASKPGVPGLGRSAKISVNFRKKKRKKS